MTETPRPSWFKRQLYKIKDKTLRGRSHERPTAAHFGSPDLSERSSSTPPDMLRGFGQRSGVSAIVPPTLSLLAPGHLTALSRESVVDVAETALAESVSRAPTSTHTQTESRLAHNVKLAAKVALEALSAATEGLPIPGAKAIVDSIRKIIDIVEVTQANQDGFQDLATRCQELMSTVFEPMKDKSLLETPPMLRDSLKKLETNLTSLLSKVEQKLSSDVLNQAINHEENTASIKDMNDQVQHFLDLYKLNIGTWTMLMLQQAHHRLVLMQLKQDLHQATAGYDDISSLERSPCFLGTREKLITEVKAWIHDSNMDKPIYALYGIAGIGKTTVAQTVAEYAASKNMLGASFFFSRAKEDCGKGDYFISTLASQLAQYDAHLADHIASALLSDPGAPSKALAFQMKHLIIEPIQKANLSQSPVIVVIDAFDECEPNHAKIILDLLAKGVQSMPNFKVFLTTRPESHIQEKLLVQGHLLPFHLHEIEKSVAKGDIDLYLRHQLSQNQVAEVFPGIICEVHFR
ncbi:hypothetical protein BDZ94DRAFT_417130 [Collybia nuda]|uniref:Nephrocystin 3-like N-terminal domain-containing protein n=1 Tax=Collybia nuda TaxID=64659 RepID=A0A9P5XVK6_9AGAR|nr:hypothetical protein BDZ94DRAFT_417130 [Collybia nuda]